MFNTLGHRRKYGLKIGPIWGLNRAYLGPVWARAGPGAGPVERHLKGIWPYSPPEGPQKGPKIGPIWGLFGAHSGPGPVQGLGRLNVI